LAAQQDKLEFDKAELEKKLLEMTTRFIEFENAQSPFRERWLVFYRYYQAYLTKKYPYNQKRIIPLAFSTIMAILPRLVLSKPQFKYSMTRIPEGYDELSEKAVEKIVKEAIKDSEVKVDELTEEEVEKYNSFIMAQIERYREYLGSLMDYINGWQWRQMRGTTKLSEIFLIGLIYGTFIMMAIWDFKHNRPEIEPIEPFEFFPDPGCTHADKLTRCFRRTYQTVEWVQEMIDNGTYYIPLPENTELKSIAEDNKDWSDKSTILGLETAEQNSIEVIEYYTAKEITTMINRKYIVRSIKNPYKRLPFIIGYNYYNPGCFWGMSEIDQLEQFIQDATDIRAIRLANLDMMTNMMWIADSTKEIYIEDLISAPSQIIRAEGGKESLSPVYPAQMPESAYSEEEVCSRYIRDVSGISDYQRGQTPGRMETATTVNTLAQTANYRFALKLENITEYMLIPMGMFFVEMNKMFLRDMKLRIPDKRTREPLYFVIDSEYIKLLDTEYDIEVIPADTKLVEKEELTQIMQIISQNPRWERRIKDEQILERVLRMFEIQTYDLFRTDEEVEKLEAAEAARQPKQPSGVPGVAGGAGIPSTGVPAPGTPGLPPVPMEGALPNV